MHHPADLTDTLPTLVDNRPGNTLLDALRRLCAESRRLDVATGFFEIGALLDLDGDWQRLEGVRLLMGDEVTRRTRQYFADILSRPRANGIERAQEDDDWKALAGLEAVKAQLLGHGGQLEIADQMAAHQSSRTTGLYDRRSDAINLNEVKSIRV